MNGRLALLLIGIIASINALAYDFKVGKLYYNIRSDGNVEVTYKKRKKIGDDKKNYVVVDIPESVTYSGTTYKVVAIGEHAFSDQIKLTTVNIPNSVVEIGDAAFMSCDELTDVDIPESVTKIGNYAFSWCSKLSNVFLPPHLKRIERSTFSGCKMMKSVDLPCSLVFIGEGAFEFSGLEALVIPNSVTTIEDGAFLYCCNLREVTIPNSVKLIGKCAFVGGERYSNYRNIYYEDEGGYYTQEHKLQKLNYDCDVVLTKMFQNLVNLETVTLGPNVKKIGNKAFYGCKSLKSVAISEESQLQQIGVEAFKDNEHLDQFDFSSASNLCTIGTGAFENTVLKNVEIPHTVTSIGSKAFDGKIGGSVKIPISVEEIGSNAFGNSKALLLVGAKSKPDGWDKEWAGSNDHICWGAKYIIGNYAYNESRKDSMALEVVGFVGEVDSVTEIPSKVIVDGYEMPVVGVGELVYCGAIKRTDIRLPQTIEYIGENAFVNWKAGSLNIPKSVKRIGRRIVEAYRNTDLVIKCELSKPRLQWEKGWSELCSVEYGDIDLPDFEYSILNNEDVALVGYNDTIMDVCLVDTVTIDGKRYRLSTIGDGAFKNSEITSISLPASVSVIGENAFENSKSLSSILLPKTIDYIGDNAFNGCSKLVIKSEFSKAESELQYSMRWNESHRPVIYSAMCEETRGLTIDEVDGLFGVVDSAGRRIIANKFNDLCVDKTGIICKERVFMVGNDWSSAVFEYALDGAMIRRDFSELIRNAEPGSTSPSRVGKYGKDNGYKELEAWEMLWESQYKVNSAVQYAEKGNRSFGELCYQEALAKANMAIEIKPDFTEAKEFAGIIGEQLERIRDEIRQEEMEREERERQEQIERAERERARKEAAWQAVTDGLNKLSQTLDQMNTQLQQTQQRKNNARQQSASRSSSTSSSSSYSTSKSSASTSHSASHKYKKLCKHCWGSKRCQFDEISGLSKIVLGTYGAKVCTKCYGSGVCQYCTDVKADPNAVCHICKGDRGCVVCKGKGRFYVNGKLVICKNCKGKMYCPACNGKGSRYRK